MSNKIQKGQTVYLVTENRGKFSDPTPVVVTSVGKKYFYVDNGPRFFLDTLGIDAGGYSSQDRCYLSEQEYYDVVERKMLSDQIRKSIGAYGDINLPLDILRKVHELLTPTP